MLKGLNEKLNSSNLLEASGIAENAKLGRWYKPVVIATEESRTNTEFGKLTTPDEVKEVVVPEGGIIAVAYRAEIKSSVSEAGRVAIFLGANQLKNFGGVAQEAKFSATSSYLGAHSTAGGLAADGAGLTIGTTGETLATSASTTGGLCFFYAAAATYTVSIQYKSTSGSITAKERTLNVGVLGF